MIKLYKGADNSIIYGLNITVDTDAKNYTGADNLPLWPILAIQVSNITIKDNYIRNNATNSHALGLGDVFHSTIYNNTLISGSHPFYLLGCDNLISHNYINAGTVLLFIVVSSVSSPFATATKSKSSAPAVVASLSILVEKSSFEIGRAHV